MANNASWKAIFQKHHILRHDFSTAPFPLNAEQTACGHFKKTSEKDKTRNTIIRQLFYPYRQWRQFTRKPIHLLFFEKRGDHYMLWQYQFTDPANHNSIELINSKRYLLIK